MIRGDMKQKARNRLVMENKTPLVKIVAIKRSRRLGHPRESAIYS
jgi:hypothetical protein